MVKSILIFVLLLMSQWASANPTNSVPFRIGEEFKQLLVQIREYAISPEDAEMKFKNLMYRLQTELPPQRIDSANVALVFPLKGKNFTSVGGRGSGFRPKGFDLFDQNVKGSHPAHDIFIRDRNQDCIDDLTGEYTDVVAVSDGVVLATETNWQDSSDYRGGNYIWMYDFQTGGLWYYAHQRQVFVYPGQVVSAGQKIAEVGRTGANAAAKRSDTHLHLMYLNIEPDFSPRPLNTYEWLKKASTKYETEWPSLQFFWDKISFPSRPIPSFAPKLNRTEFSAYFSTKIKNYSPQNIALGAVPKKTKRKKH